MDFIDYDLDYNYNGVGGQQSGSSSSSSHGNGLHGSSSSNPSASSANDLLNAYRCVLLHYPVNSTHSLLTYYTLWLTNGNPLYPPADFTPVHHAAFQVSQLCFLVYLFVARINVLPLTLLLLFAVVQLAWGVLIMKSADICAWNLVHAVVILIRITVSCCCGDWRIGGGGGSNIGKSPSSRRIKSEQRSGKGLIVSPSSIAVCGGGGSASMNGSAAAAKVKGELDLIYNRLFAPVRVSYKQFKLVLSCKRGFKNLQCGENYSVEKRTRVDSLGLLVSGRLVVSQSGKPLHVILPYQFVDSPEYFGVSTDELFQVTISALEDSKLLVWHRDKLRLTIMSDEFLRVMLDHIIGRDVVRKLIQVSDTIMTTTTISGSGVTSTTSSSPPGGGVSSSNGGGGGTTTNNGLSVIPSSNNNNNGNGGGGGGGSPPGGNNNNNNASPCAITAITNSTPSTAATAAPLIMVRNDNKVTRHVYGTYLTSLSEEKLSDRKIAGGGGGGSFGEEDEEEEEEEDEEEEEEGEEEEEDEEEDEEDDQQQQEEDDAVMISGNEREPMLVGGCQQTIVAIGDK